MKKTDATQLIKATILLKEIEQDTLGRLLKNDLNIMYESVKPINMLKDVVKNLVKSPSTGNSILDTTLGLTAGYLSKKLIVRTSHNPLIKIVGSIFQFGISTMVMKSPDTIKLVGGYILKNLFRKKEADTEKVT